jgi:uncharacterized membrane protein YecN with MAPEG domain
MMSFFVCAGLLGLLAVALLSNVGRVRGKTRIFIGDGGNTELITAMRAGKFRRSVPLALLLIWLVSTFYGAATIATLLVLLVLARVLHAAGMLASAVRPAWPVPPSRCWCWWSPRLGRLAGLGVKLY